MAQPINSSLTSFFVADGFGRPAPGLATRLARLLTGGGPSERSARASRDHRTRIDALDALTREADRIRLQSRHWLM